MEVIIIAAIALLVLVVLSVLVLRAAGDVSEACKNTGGSCTVGEDASACGEGEVFNNIDCGTGKVCCVALGNQNDY